MFLSPQIEVSPLHMRKASPTASKLLPTALHPARPMSAYV
jgi:hypothetical protein